MATRTRYRGYTRPARLDRARIEEAVSLPLDDVDTDVHQLAQVAVMTGEIRMWSLPNAPAGWVFADGSPVTIAVSERLRQLYIDAGYPYGRSVTDPLLPDYGGRVPIGATPGRTGISPRGLGTTGGAERITLTEAQMPAHWHMPSDPADFRMKFIIAEGWTSNLFAPGTGTRVYYPSGVTSSPSNTHSAGGDRPHENMQPFAVVNFIVKT